MKCIILNLLFFTAFFTCFSSFAQLEKGTFVINENFGFSTSKTEKDDFANSNIYTRKSNRFDFNTSFGYLFKDKQELGIAFGIGREKYKYNNTNFDSNYDTDSKRYGISLYYKKYVSLAEKLHFFVSPRIGYRYDLVKHTEYNISSNISNSKTNTIGAYLYTGFMYSVSQRVGLSINLVGAGLQYSSSKAEKENQYIEKTNGFSSSMYDYFGFGGLNLGIQFML